MNNDKLERIDTAALYRREPRWRKAASGVRLVDRLDTLMGKRLTAFRGRGGCWSRQPHGITWQETAGGRLKQTEAEGET